MPGAGNHHNRIIYMKKLFYFGNPYIEEDNLAIKIIKRLKKEFNNIEFKHIENTFQLVDLDFENSLLLDVVQGLKEIKILDVKDIKNSSLQTAHDFDLGFFLNLTEKKVKIIGIPQFYEENLAFNKVKSILKDYSQSTFKK